MTECRLCLSSAPFETYVPIYDNTQAIERHIWNCCHLKVEQGDGLPDSICLSCESQLESFANFKKACIKNDEILRRRSSKSRIKMEEITLEDYVWEENVDIKPVIDKRRASTADKDFSKQIDANEMSNPHHSLKRKHQSSSDLSSHDEDNTNKYSQLARKCDLLGPINTDEEISRLFGKSHQILSTGVNPYQFSPLINSKKSGVWSFFVKEIGEVANCVICKSKIKCKGGSTSGLANHLKLKHGIDSKKSENTDQIPVKCLKLTSNIRNCVKTETLPELLAKCVAHDGFSIKDIVNSTALKEFFNKRGYQMPQNPLTVKTMILEFYNQRKLELRDELLKFKESGSRFSISVDEWTDLNHRRYLNVTLHDTKKNLKTEHKLGLTFIKDTCDAFTLKKLITNKLNEFGLNLNTDIISCTHDGAEVMKKYGHLIGIESQLCYNNAIHLAIMDVFYKKITSNERELFDNDSSDNDESDEDLDCFISDVDVNSNYYPRLELYKVLKNVRQIVCYFKNSNRRNYILQKYVLEQEKNEMRLVLDCKNRWNSLIPMIEVFLKIKECIRKALIETGSENMYNEIDFTILENILYILKPTELAVKELSKIDANILTAEGIFNFLFDKLKKKDSSLSFEIYEALTKRISERRNKTLVSLIKYLQNASVPKTVLNPTQTYASKSSIISYAKTIIQRLYPGDFENSNDLQITEVAESSQTSKEMDVSKTDSLISELQKSISSVMNVPEVQSSDTWDLDKDFKLLELTGNRTPNLDNLFNCVLTIQPTATASERVFSVADQFCKNIQNSMKHDTLDALVFLKYYFMKLNHE
ncbi:uncharacterized protein LOC143920672 isoform X3 [Arctopsyche grandis]|uniref:uncharacterized protein LOC143920672 isoform X3 n=1 Tax=Arctopsyche grandis TaxID=121162 RepID=UPI00406D7433